jgi:hypothetical protein
MTLGSVDATPSKRCETTANVRHKLRKFCDLPPLRIRHRVAEHIEEDRLQQVIEPGESRAAFGAEGVGRVENGRDPPLFGERGERKFYTTKLSNGDG